VWLPFTQSGGIEEELGEGGSSYQEPGMGEGVQFEADLRELDWKVRELGDIGD
jgi:hypothetical protein